MTEAELINGCKRLDSKCQKAVVGLIGPFLMSVCRRYAPANHLAEDLLQESFINIFRFINSFDNSKGSFKAWTKKVTINTSLKYLGRIKIKADNIEEVTLNASHPTVFSNLATDELLSHIEKLPDGYKQIFNMYVIEGYDHKEIAEQLGIKASTSRSNLTRAKKLLRDKISPLTNKEQWIKIG